MLPRVLVWKIKASKLPAIKPVGVAVTGETLSLRGAFVGETHGVLEHTQTHPPTQESAPEGPNLLVGSRGSESHPRAKQVALFPLRPLPHI